MDWCPPDGFNPDVVPIIHKSFDNADGIQLKNGAVITSGKVSEIISPSSRSVTIKLRSMSHVGPGLA